MTGVRLPGRLEGLAAGFAPGALVGVHLAGLIFFLNPGLPFAAAPVLRGILLYGTLLGLAGLALHLPLTWGRPRRARRVLPWALSAALAGSALLDAFHASWYAYYLPPGINERLIKTAFWLALAALITFYTALLHSLHHRPYGRRSRWGLSLLAVLSVYAMLERREAFQPRPQPTPRPASVETGRRPSLWVVGLDTATLDAILPLAGQGKLPFFSEILRQGSYGRLESFEPLRSAAAWTTLATGKLPFKHGVLGGRAYPAGFLAPGEELRLLPAGIGFRRWGTLGGRGSPPGAVERRAPALWEILPRLDIATGLAGWPASSPVPPAPTRELQGLLGEIAPEVRQRLGSGPALQALAGDLWRERVARELAAESPRAEVVFLGLPGLRTVSRESFGGFSALQFEGEKGAGVEAAAARVAAYYAAMDELLGRVWSQIEGPKILAIVSAHGVHPRESRLGQRERLEGGFSGAPDGALLLYGQGIRPGALLTGARLEDLVPTLLYALGFPVARDFDGRVLTSAFDRAFLASHPLTFLPSYEALVDPEADAETDPEIDPNPEAAPSAR